MARTAPQLPNNTTTASTQEVYSSTGYNAGDLVYFQNGNYVGASNLTPPSSVNFSVSGQAAIFSGASGGYTSPVFSQTNYANNIPGAGRLNCFGKLSNGNTVQVWTNSNTNYPYFQIFNGAPSTNVVAPTQISSGSSAAYGNITVAALTGGGFAVIWVDYSTGYVWYAIYSNTGSVVTAATQDTTFSLSGLGAINYITAQPLANGGFVVGVYNPGSGYINLRAYSATGTGAFSPVQPTYSSASPNGIFSIATRSDSSFIVFYQYTGSQMAYEVWSATGTALTWNAFSATAGSIQGYYNSVTTLSDGTTFVLAYPIAVSGHSTIAFRLLPTGNSLGTERTVPYQNLYYSTGLGSFVSVLGLSSGGFVLTFNDGAYIAGAIFYDSTGTVVQSGTNSNGAVPVVLPGVQNGVNIIQNSTTSTSVQLIENSSTVTIYWCNDYYQDYNSNFFYSNINKTTYQPVPVSSITVPLGTLAATPGSVVSSSVTPTSTKYYAGSTQSSTTLQTLGVYASAPQTIASYACDSYSADTLANGNIVIAYRNISTYAITANVYTASGSFVTSFSVGTGNNTNLYQSLRVSALPGGSYAIAWYDNLAHISWQLYSSSNALVNSGSISSPISYNDSYGGIQMIGLSSNRFAIFWTYSSGYIYYAVYDNSGTQLIAPTQLQPSGAYYCYYYTVSAGVSGGFMVSAYYPPYGSTYGFQFYPSGSTSYSPTPTSPFGMPGTNAGSWSSNIRIVGTQGGSYVVPSYSNGGSSYIRFTTFSEFSSYYNYTTNFSAANSNSPSQSYGNAVGQTGNGTIVYLGYYNSTTARLYAFGLNPYSSMTYPASNTVNLTISMLSSTSNPWICPGFGNNAVIGWLDTNNYPNFAIVNAFAQNQTISVTGGVTQSNTVSIYPNSSSSSNISNAVLAGVGMTTVPSGGTGPLLINGLATLNSNYSATTPYQSFDYQGTGVLGVRGTISGRNVNLQGNS